jgi:hypothetical protein
MPKKPITLKIEEITRKYGAWPPPGTVAWRQGFCWRHWFPPYGPEDWLFSRKPIPGVPYAEGPGSAFATITALGGFAPTDAQGNPRTLHYAMGLHDLTVVPNVKGKDPGIYFTLDEKDASWSPEKVAERQAEEAQQAESQKPVETIQQPQLQKEATKPKIAGRQKKMQQSPNQEREMPREYVAESEQRMAQPSPTQAIPPLVTQAIVQEKFTKPVVLQEESVEPVAAEAKELSEEQAGFEEQLGFEGEISYLDDFVGGWKEQKEASSFMEGFIGEKEEIAPQAKETETPNLIPVEMKNWGVNPAYKPLLKTRKRVARQPLNQEELNKTGIVMAR